jgi:hypothetical protein
MRLPCYWQINEALPSIVPKSGSPLALPEVLACIPRGVPGGLLGIRHVASPLLLILENGGSALQFAAMFWVVGALLKWPMASPGEDCTGDQRALVARVRDVEVESV